MPPPLHQPLDAQQLAKVDWTSPLSPREVQDHLLSCAVDPRQLAASQVARVRADHGRDARGVGMHRPTISRS